MSWREVSLAYRETFFGLASLGSKSQILPRPLPVPARLKPQEISASNYDYV